MFRHTRTVPRGQTSQTYIYEANSSFRKWTLLKGEIHVQVLHNARGMQSSTRSPVLWTCAVLTVLSSLILFILLLILRRIIIPWYPVSLPPPVCLYYLPICLYKEYAAVSILLPILNFSWECLLLLLLLLLLFSSSSNSSSSSSFERYSYVKVTNFLAFWTLLIVSLLFFSISSCILSMKLLWNQLLWAIAKIISFSSFLFSCETGYFIIRFRRKIIPADLCFLGRRESAGIKQTVVVGFR